MIAITDSEHWLKERFSAQPDRQAFIISEKNISYREFYTECLAAADFLIARGIRDNDNVGLLFSHNYNFFIVVNALWFIGAVPVPLNTRLLTEEFTKQINMADVKYLLIDESLAEQFSQLKFENKIYLPSNSPLQTFNKNRKIVHSPLFGRTQFSIHNCSLIMFTSGSTGNSKAVVHTFKSLSESVRALDAYVNLSPDDVWLASLPLYHIGGFMILVRSLLAGSAIAIPASPSHEDILSGLKRYNPSHVSMVPTTLFRLIKENISPDAKLKYAFLGGGPADMKLISNAIEKNWPIVKVYGSTESCSMITALLPGDSKDKLESAGKILGGVKIKTAESGEIIVSSKSLFKEYYNDPVNTTNALKEDWYYTGDLGRMDNDGYLILDGRREDIIISGGENVSSAEVEKVLISHPSISDAFVFALDDDTWGQMVCAALVTNNFDKDKILDFLKTKIAGYKIPKRLFQIDKIPRNELGKVSRHELLNLLNLD